MRGERLLVSNGPAGRGTSVPRFLRTPVPVGTEVPRPRAPRDCIGLTIPYNPLRLPLRQGYRTGLGIRLTNPSDRYVSGGRNCMSTRIRRAAAGATMGIALTLGLASTADAQ